MKNLLLLFSVFIFTTVSMSQTLGLEEAPCISGPSSITVNNTAVYTASGAAGYYWSVTSGLQIIGSNANSTVTVKCTGTGGTLSLVKFKNGVCSPCSVSITCTGCSGNPTAYFIPDHTISYVWKTIGTVLPSNYTSLVWSSTESRVQQINPNTSINPTVTLTPGTIPVTLDFTATITYADGCVYEEDFSVGFSYNTPSDGTSGSEEMSIAPNPTNSGQVNIAFNNSMSGTLELIDLVTGSMLHQKSIANSMTSFLEIGSLKSGIYLVRFTDSSGSSIDKKMVVE